MNSIDEELKFPGTIHAHTDFSNLRLRDSINTYKTAIDYTISLGQKVIGITEHETIANAVKVEKYYKKIKEKHPDFKVILGNEIYLCRDGLNAENFSKENGDKYYHWILLAKDAIGHQQIREISTRAWMRSYVTNKMRRVPTYYQDLIDIIGKNPGHVIGSTACLGGFVGTKLSQYRQTANIEILDKLKTWLLSMRGIFGSDNFYLEMQPSRDLEQIFVNRHIRAISRELGIPYIITTDAHYLNKADQKLHKAFLNSQDGEREVDSFYQTTYFMDTEELESYMEDYMTKEDFQYAYQNIIDIMNKCEDYSLLKPLNIPSLIWQEPKSSITDVEKYYNVIPYLKTFIESDFKGDNVLAKLVVDKLNSDIRMQDYKIYKELNENLETTWVSSGVNKAHWSAYFLNLQNILDVCWRAGSLVGPGRGSGVGFALLYALDLIQINPMWENTRLFGWRLTDWFKGLLNMVTYLQKTA